jgi:ATP-dependent protease ClpP protease subunit
MKMQVAIRFMAEVNQQSINALMSIIEAKMREGAKEIKILLTSPGGSVFHGISAYNYLKGIPVKVETHNFGAIDSISAIIYCAGSKRLCVKNARFLIHGVAWGVGGAARFEEKQLKEQIKGMEIDRENIAKIIAENCNKTQKDIEDAMYEGTTLNPEQAKQFGLVHEINDILLPEGVEIIGIG